jgi:hypothetical protein
LALVFEVEVKIEAQTTRPNGQGIGKKPSVNLHPEVAFSSWFADAPNSQLKYLPFGVRE